ncbi:MAG: ribulokinase [Calditrichaeota bacterium]|nr:ribulokinase [Calditrichota bacterium]
MSEEKFVIGIDFGTDSVRSVIVDTCNGDEIANVVYYYSRWEKGEYCDPAINQFRQHPLDYIEGLTYTIKEAIAQAPAGIADKIVGISIDTTGSTPVAVDKKGTPLALTKGFEENPNAMFIIWKDHTAVKEAEEINNLAHSWDGVDYTKYVGGVYSSEWFWAKILHTLRVDETIRESAYSWVEHCDWIPALLTGNTDPLAIKRSRCAAGHKAMWHESFGGLPSEGFLEKLDPLLKGLRSRLYQHTFTSDVKAGILSPEWAEKLGLSENVAIGVGAFDAHIGAIGAEIEAYILCKVMGTSTCDMLIAPMEEIGDKTIRGICGQVDGSIIPGMLGMEAGQSAFGDIYAWFRNILLFPIENLLQKSSLLNKGEKEKLVKDISDRLLPELLREAEKLSIDETGIVALDWMNGRRTPDANQLLKGGIAGLNLGSDAAKIFRALVEATAFGAKKIVDRFIAEGVSINGVIALGGIPKKSPFIMQVVCDVLNMPIKVARSDQTCALGAAMCAATAAGVYDSIEQAQKNMGNGFEKQYQPHPESAEKYNLLYNKYSKFGNFTESALTSH